MKWLHALPRGKGRGSSSFPTQKKLIIQCQEAQTKMKPVKSTYVHPSWTKDLCLSFALYRLLRCRFDDLPLPADSIKSTRKLMYEIIGKKDEDLSTQTDHQTQGAFNGDLPPQTDHQAERAVCG